ncbi:hypothetical protein L1987_86181 [Smallanthus sonchifolius]|uniref:Uncharacterized protein n=1 Tax=Smallanthus sonchifolius TaxID=185202 RepID=A0ACB8XZT4_9ASTR|nr:hypothetical protein L1987_86181 [Smallanthus sonchifolius]
MDDKYEKLEKVGEGTYGKVYKAKDKLTGELVALKKTRLEMDEEGIPRTAVREISLLQKLSNSIYMVRLIGVQHIHHNGKPLLYLVFEYLDTDLKKFIDSHRKGPNPSPLPDSQIQRFMFQLCKDLGLGRTFTLPVKSYTHEIVTLWYRAPEVLLGSTHYSTGVDMWSVGCIFGLCFLIFLPFVLFTSVARAPTEQQWPGVTSLKDWHVYPRWEPKNLAHVVPSLGPDGIDLLSKMMKYNPGERISAKAAMEHPYFDSLDKSQF